MNKNNASNILLPVIFAFIIGAVLFINFRQIKDPKIVLADTGEYLYTTQDTPFEAGFGVKEDPNKIIFKSGDSILSYKLPSDDLSWDMVDQKLIAKSASVSYSYTLINPKGSKKNTIIGIKEEIILNKPTDQTEFTFTLEFENLKYQKREDGLWHFYNDNNEEIFFIPKPYMEDAKGSRSENLTIDIKDSKLKISVDKEWLMSPDRVYPIKIDPTLQLTILTVHSHPQEGDNWVVDFETEGQADLTISPDDQATIDDIDFVSLTCEGNPVEVEILENDTIFVPEFQCAGTGTLTHLVNVAAPHRLKFNFGGVIAYAYNAPGSTTYTYSGVTQSTNDHFAYEKYSSASSFTGPDDTGNAEATNTDYGDITSDNASRWITNASTSPGDYNSQLYKFFISESEPAVTQLDFKWNGFGTTAPGFSVDFYAYDYDATSWFQLDTNDFTSETDADLTFTSTSSPSRFIDTDGEVTLMATVPIVAHGTDTIGSNSPASGVEDTTVGGFSWSGYTNVYSSDSNYATVSLSKGETSYYIKATNFGFSYNFSCTSVDGITVEVQKVSNDTADMKDFHVYLVDGTGTIVGDDKADTVTDWSTTEGYVIYGGSADNWNAGLTCSDITNSNFGVVFSAQNTVPTQPRTIIASVNHIRITVDYSY